MNRHRGSSTVRGRYRWPKAEWLPGGGLDIFVRLSSRTASLALADYPHQLDPSNSRLILDAPGQVCDFWEVPAPAVVSLIRPTGLRTGDVVTHYLQGFRRCRWRSNSRSAEGCCQTTLGRPGSEMKVLYFLNILATGRAVSERTRSYEFSQGLGSPVAIIVRWCCGRTLRGD